MSGLETGLKLIASGSRAINAYRAHRKPKTKLQKLKKKATTLKKKAYKMTAKHKAAISRALKGKSRNPRANWAKKK